MSEQQENRSAAEQAYEEQAAAMDREQADMDQGAEVASEDEDGDTVSISEAASKAAKEHEDRIAAEKESQEAEEEAVQDEEASDSDGADDLRAQLSDVQDQLMRQTASFRNFRRRAEKEKSVIAEFGKADAIRNLLDVVDDFDRSIQSASEVEEQDEPDFEAAFYSLKEGVEMIYAKMMDELRRMEVEPIDAEGEPFNEHEHEAMMQQPAPDGVEEGTVLQEVQKGYRMGDRVLRHSRVIVAGGS